MLSIILSKRPSNWEEADYKDVLFETFLVPKSGLEFNSVAQQFGQLSQYIKTIERVQHIYSFGRFLLQKEKLVLSNQPISEKLVYHVVNAKDLTVALQYNCDTRRYETNPNGHITPRFHPSPPFVSKEEVVIILRELQDENQKSEACYYPAYVVHVH